MSDSGKPPSTRPPRPEDHDPLDEDAGFGHGSQGGHGSHGGYGDDDLRTPLERILPELLRRGLKSGKGTLESVVPKDVAAGIASQLVDVRAGVVKAVAQEVGRFLREADIASELRKVLVGVDMEATVKLRFKARPDGGLEVETKVDEADMSVGGPTGRSERPPAQRPPED